MNDRWMRPGASSQWCTFSVPSSVWAQPSYQYQLFVSTNGIASPPVTFQAVSPQPTVLPVNFNQVPGVTQFNAFGVYADGATFSATGGLSNSSSAYSQTLLGSTQTWNGMTFLIGPAGAQSALSNVQVQLPGVSAYSTINLLATGAFGNQTSQVFKVTYTDGTSDSFTQSLSDWHTPQSYAGESIVKSMGYRDQSDGTQQFLSFYLYGYSFPINPTKTLNWLTLPNNVNVNVLAVTLR